MPKSDEIFGIGGGDPNTALANLMGDPGMFPNINAMGRQSEPTAEDMEKGAEEARYGKIVKIKYFHVKTWDLSDPKQVEDYQRGIVELYVATAQKRSVINHLEKKMLLHEGKPKLCVHLEWYEYDMEVKDHMTGKQYNSAEEFVEYKSNGKKKRSNKKVDTGPNRRVAQEDQGEQGEAPGGAVAII